MFTLATMTAVAAAAVIATSVLIDTDQTQTPAAEAPPPLTVEEQPFSGSFSFGPTCLDEDGNDIEYCWLQSNPRFDDPRFEGTVTMWANPDYLDAGVYRNQFTITTDEGAWVGDPVPGLLAGPAKGSPSVHLFTGEGAYDGLYAVATAVLTNERHELEGYVVHGDFPELPER